jgi:hypothetical protein
MVRIRNAYKTSLGKPQGFGRSRCRWEDNIKMYVKEIGCGLDSIGPE